MKRLIFILMSVLMLSMIAVKMESEVEIPSITPEKIEYRGNLYDYIDSIAMAESSDNQFAINQIGMLGRYQFSPKTLDSLGFRVTKEQFLRNRRLQDSAMIRNLQENARVLQDIIKKFSNTNYRGIHITTSGILAGAHLVGAGGVRTYFYPHKYSHRTVDANGMRVETYIQKFGNYRLTRTGD